MRALQDETVFFLLAAVIRLLVFESSRDTTLYHRPHRLVVHLTTQVQSMTLLCRVMRPDGIGAEGVWSPAVSCA